MLKPFHAFMEKTIDYAGLFPPAKLSMDDAIRKYTQYRQEPDQWMLSRFICPVSRLSELEQYQDNLFRQGDPFRFSVLGSGGKDEKEFLDKLITELGAINEFLNFHGGRVIVDAFEARLPLELLKRADVSEITRFLNTAAVTIEKNGPPEITTFYEVAFIKGWKNVVTAATKAIADHNRYVSGSSHFTRYQKAGFKLRCGGVEPHLYPTGEQMAYTIFWCGKNLAPMKGTAGLHHPLRHFNSAEMVKMHGFFNFFGAVIAAEAHGLNLKQIQEIIEDENPANFLFTTRAFAWKNLRTSVDEIKKARKQYIISFGCCNFDEPREDLRIMKLL